MIRKIIMPLALLCLFSSATSAQWNPRPGWKDSYAVDGQCYCDSSNYDHGLDTKSADTPIGVLNVMQICADIKNVLGVGSTNGRIPYNDIQCGHGPANNAADEAGCPGRVDIGSAGCNVKGPTWNLEKVYNDDGGPTNGFVSTSASRNSGDTNNAIDDNANTRWTTRQSQRAGQWFELDLGEVETVGKVVLDSSRSNNDYPAGYSVSTSTDGSSYTVVATGSGSSGITEINFTNHSVRYIRITQTGSKSRNWWSIHELDVGLQSDDPVDNGGTKLSRDNWVMYASSKNELVSNAIDGNANSRWSTGQSQRNGQWFEIDLSKTETFNKIVLDTTRSAMDFPRSFTVRVSNDGSNWTTVASGVGETITNIPFGSQNARYVRIEQSGSDGYYWWSIHEVNLYR